MGNRLWVLGGNDGEMEAIKMLLGLAGEKFVQPGQKWGDLRYGAQDLGLISPAYLVFVECRPKGDFGSARLQIIDHHNECAGQPPAVLQVLKILEESGLRISDATRRWVELAAANDTGAYHGLESIGATAEEMQRIRAFTRKAQGITPKHESASRGALVQAQISGRVLVIQGQSVKNVCVVDELYTADRKDQEFLIVNGGSFHFSGDGQICGRLKDTFGGWAGGAGLDKKGDKRAFWGCNGPASKLDEILAEINR